MYHSVTIKDVLPLDGNAIIMSSAHSTLVHVANLLLYLLIL